MSWLSLLSTSPPRVLYLYASSSTRTTRAGCTSSTSGRAKKSKYCTGVQHIEFKIYLQCSRAVQGRKSREILLRMHAVSTTLYRSMGGFTLPNIGREGMIYSCSMPESCRKMPLLALYYKRLQIQHSNCSDLTAKAAPSQVFVRHQNSRKMR